MLTTDRRWLAGSNAPAPMHHACMSTPGHLRPHRLQIQAIQQHGGLRHLLRRPGSARGVLPRVLRHRECCAVVGLLEIEHQPQLADGANQGGDVHLCHRAAAAAAAAAWPALLESTALPNHACCRAAASWRHETFPASARSLCGPLSARTAASSGCCRCCRCWADLLRSLMLCPLRFCRCHHEVLLCGPHCSLLPCLTGAAAPLAASTCPLGRASYPPPAGRTRCSWRGSMTSRACACGWRCRWGMPPRWAASC